MSESIKAYQGKEFTVSLQSMVGSTSYGWCLTSMPDEIALASICYEPTGAAGVVAPVNQIFTFFALGYSSDIKPIEFQEICLFDPRKTGRKISVKVDIIPYNVSTDGDSGLEDFVEYSENSAVFNSIPNIRVAYGIPPYMSAGDDVSIEKYGVACVDYGLPCVKYGAPCIEHTLTLEKYGVPCIVKYGIACTNK